MQSITVVSDFEDTLEQQACGGDSVWVFYENKGEIRQAFEMIAADNEKRQDTKQHETAALCVDRFLL